MKNKICVIGSGSMATAISKILYDAGHLNLCIYGINKLELEQLKNGQNLKYFSSNSKIPKFKTTLDLNLALENSKIIVLAVPSFAIDVVFSNILKKINSKVIIINVAKGFYPKTHYSLHKGLEIKSKKNKNIHYIASLIGPSHAEEIVKESPTVISVVGKNIKLNKEIQSIFKNKYFKTEIQTDIKGAEVGAAYKNVLAIVSGIFSGLNYGINTVSALLIKGLEEMILFNKKIGGKKDTIIGLTGLGDLIVTAMSDLSRNFYFGKQFALEGKKSLEKEATVEGLVALKYIYEIGKKKNILLPIVNFLYDIIYKNKPIKQIINIL